MKEVFRSCKFHWCILIQVGFIEMRFDRFFEFVVLAILVFPTLTQPLVQVKKAMTLPSHSRRSFVSEGAKESLEGIMTVGFKCLRDCFISYYRYQLATAQSIRLGGISAKFGLLYQTEQMECTSKIKQLGVEIHSHKKSLNEEDENAVENIKTALEGLLAQLGQLLSDQRWGRGVPDETSPNLIKKLKQLWGMIVSFKARNARNSAKLLLIRIEGVGYLNKKLELIAMFAGTFAHEQVSLTNLFKIAVKLTGFLGDLRLALGKLEVPKSSLTKICLQIDTEAQNGKQVIKFIQELAKDPIVTFLTAVSQQNQHAAHISNHNLREWLRLVSIFIELRSLIINFFESYQSETKLKEFKSKFIAKIKMLLLKIPNSQKSKLAKISSDIEASCNNFLSKIRGKHIETCESTKDYLQNALTEQHIIWRKLEAEEKSHLAPDCFAGCLLYLGTARFNIQSSKVNLMLARLTASNDHSSISALGKTIYVHLLKLEKQIPEKMQDCQAIDYSVWKPQVLLKIASDLDKQRIGLGASIRKENQKTKNMGEGKIGSIIGRIGGKITNRMAILTK